MSHGFQGDTEPPGRGGGQRRAPQPQVREREGCVLGSPSGSLWAELENGAETAGWGERPTPRGGWRESACQKHGLSREVTNSNQTTHHCRFCRTRRGECHRFPTTFPGAQSDAAVSTWGPTQRRSSDRPHARQGRHVRGVWPLGPRAAGNRLPVTSVVSHPAPGDPGSGSGTGSDHRQRDGAFGPHSTENSSQPQLSAGSSSGQTGCACLLCTERGTQSAPQNKQ